MLADVVVYDCITKTSRIEKMEVDDVINEPIPEIEPTLEEKVKILEEENKRLKEVNSQQSMKITELDDVTAFLIEDSLVKA